MKTILCTLPLLLAALEVRAGNQGDIKPIVDKALQALGGAENLAKTPVATWKGKGTARFMGQPFKYSGEWTTQGPGLSRVELDIKVGNNSIPYLKVVKDNEAW